MVTGLQRLGNAVDAVEDAAAADVRCRHEPYDVVILDRMLPGTDGLTLLRQWRDDGLEVPVLMLTALRGIEERVRGLDNGADDYLTKPFAFDELVARLHALHRRRPTTDTSRTLGPLTIDPTGHSATLDGDPLPLTAREFSLLELLTRRPGQVYTRGQIEARLYSEETAPSSNAVDAAVYALRRKLATPRGTFIQTRRGLGYVAEWTPKQTNKT